MFADYVKMAAKVAVIAVATGIIIAVFNNIQVPTPDLQAFGQAVGMGKAFVNYWVPGLLPFVNLFIGLVLLDFALKTAYIGLIAIRWVLKVNE